MTAEEIQAEHERFRGWFETAGQYPHIARLMEAGVDPDDPDTREERFQFSLDCVLDGIAARIALAARAEPASPPDPPPPRSRPCGRPLNSVNGPLYRIYRIEPHNGGTRGAGKLAHELTRPRRAMTMRMAAAYGSSRSRTSGVSSPNGRRHGCSPVPQARPR